MGCGGVRGQVADDDPGTFIVGNTTTDPRYGSTGFVVDLFVEAGDVINGYRQSDLGTPDTAVYRAALTATLISQNSTNSSNAVHSNVAGKT